MIEIHHKNDCCGCWACVQRCPKQCISMRTDDEGFKYPVVDASLCVDCGACERVCPVINQAEPSKPLTVIAAASHDDGVLAVSSSGGLFTVLARQVIADGGIVFGAKFDADWSVVHASAETETELEALRRSKYVQSDIGTAFAQAEKELKAGRKVMFVGVPCQIAGLRRFLSKDYDNLLAVDVVCHGVPSPGVWQSYLKQSHLGEIKGVNFRDKRNGWKDYTVAINGQDEDAQHFNSNPYMHGFLIDLYLRPSCYSCPARSLKSQSDLTLGDFWGIENVMPHIDNDKGTSIVLINTPKGQNAIDSILTKIKTAKSDYATATRYNPAIVKAPSMPVNRGFFFRLFKKDGFSKAYAETVSTNPLLRIKRKLFRML